MGGVGFRIGWTAGIAWNRKPQGTLASPQCGHAHLGVGMS
jgi:hypothetical protein